MLMLFALTLPLILRADGFEYRATDRLFRLNYGGYTSYLLVTTDGPVQDGRRDVALALQAMNTSCAVYLTGPGVRSAQTKLEVPGFTKPILLADHLTKIGRHRLNDLGVAHLLNRQKPILEIAAWRAIRDRFQNLRWEKFARGFAQRRELNYTVNAHLKRAARIIFGEKITKAELYEMAGIWAESVVHHELETGSLFETDARQGASDRGIGAIDLTSIFTSVDGSPDLESMVEELARAHYFETDLYVYANALIALYLSFELSHHFFEFSADRIGLAREALHQSGFMEESKFTGEDFLDRFESGLPSRWLTPLLYTMAERNTFIALDARFALPQNTSRPRQSLIELLVHSGVRITPVRDRRDLLEVVQK